MTNRDNRFAKIKSEIQRLQLYVLMKFFECAMYQALGESWKEKVASKAMFKTITGNYKDNYIKIINSIKRKKNFDVEDLDITALVTLIRYDFLSECCTYKSLKATDLSFIIKQIKDDRNSLAHSPINSDDYRVCSNAIENLERFQIYLEENDWVYEEIPDSTKYSQNKQMEEKFSLKYIGQEISNCKGILESLSMLSVINNNKRVTIEFVDSYGQAVENISCLIESKIYLSKLSYSYEKIKKIDVSLLLGEYMIICIGVPEDYEKFETEILNIKASDSYNISKKIILHKKKIFEDKIESERFGEPLSCNENVSLLQTNAMVKNEKVRVNICLLDEEKNFVKKCKMQILNKNNKVLKNWISTNRPFVYDFYYGNYRIEILETPPMFIKPTIQLLEINELQLNEKELNYEVILYKIKKKELFISIVDEKKDFVSGLEIEVFNESNDNKAFFSCITDARPIKFLLRPGKYIIKIINSDFEIENSVLVFNVLDDSTESRLEWMIYKKIVNDSYLNLNNIDAVRYNKKVSALITDNEDRLKKYNITDAKNLNLEAKNSNIENFDAEKLFQKGYDYYYANGVERDFKKAVVFFAKAAEKEYSCAQHSLATCYMLGEGVEFNLEKAFRLFYKAACAGYSESEYQVGRFYEKGYFVKSNLVEAVQWYQKASEHGCLNAKAILGYFYLNGSGVVKNERTAYEYTSEAANQGHIVSIRNLGIFYQNGIGVEQSYSKAKKCYEMALEHGDKKAEEYLNNLKLLDVYVPKGTIYIREESQSKIKKENILLKKIKEDTQISDMEIQYELGKCYENGKEIDKDFIKAAEWYRKAAKQNFKPAKVSLIKLIKEYPSLADPNDPICLADYLSSSKLYDNPIYQYRIGLCYEHGLDCTKNVKEAFYWYEKAAKQDYQFAKEACRRLEEDYPNIIKRRTFLTKIFN